MSDGAPGRGSFSQGGAEPIHILFVDDDPIVREFATVHLVEEQVRVSLADDGDTALDMIDADAPDIILLDLEMPRMDGFEVLTRLGAQPHTRRLPVIVVTGREDTAAIDRAYESGAASFLVKPINWRLLSHQIRYVRRASRVETALASLSRSRQEENAARTQVRRLAEGGA
ncbi:MAG: response regulator, partial [Caulobacteraceae bacterium]